MHSSRDDTFVAAGTTMPISYKSSIEDFEKYIKEELEDVFELGMKIRGYNIFYVLLMRDKKTGQLGFSVMIGDKTILDLFTKGKQL